MDLQLISPLDMHLHLREDDMLQAVAPLSAEPFAGGVIMPNLMLPVDSLEKLERYRNQIETACGDHSFAPYMTLFFEVIAEKNLLLQKNRSSA